MNSINHPRAYMRSLATRDTGSEISAALPAVLAATQAAGFDLINSDIGKLEDLVEHMKPSVNLVHLDELREKLTGIAER